MLFLSRIDISGLRKKLASGLLLGLIFISPFLNWNSTSSWVNTQISLFQVLFVLLLLPEVKREVLLMSKESTAFRVVLIFAITNLAALAWLDSEVLQGSRFWIYLIQMFFFAAVVAWFSDNAYSKLKWMLVLKLAAAVVLCSLFLVLLFQGDEVVKWSDIQFLVFRNIRHFNYDLAVAFFFAGTLCALCSQFPAKDLGFLVLFVLLGFVSFFTEGRGQILSVFCFLALLVMLVRKAEYKTVYMVLAGLLLGFSIMAVLYPEAAAGLFRRSADEGADRISSGRLTMWSRSLDYWWAGGDNIKQIIIGLGPDGFVRSRLYHGAVQPHNSIVQALMEFGILGVGLLLYLVWNLLRLTWRAAYVLRAEKSEVVWLSCALLSLFFYSLFDGILYHGHALLICVLLGAYLYAAAVGNSAEKPLKIERQ